jgi:hypothetical protein
MFRTNGIGQGDGFRQIARVDQCTAALERSRRFIPSWKRGELIQEDLLNRLHQSG